MIAHICGNICAFFLSTFYYESCKSKSIWYNFNCDNISVRVLSNLVLALSTQQYGYPIQAAKTVKSRERW